jgi:hypothetical protein
MIEGMPTSQPIPPKDTVNSPVAKQDATPSDAPSKVTFREGSVDWDAICQRRS